MGGRRQGREERAEGGRHEEGGARARPEAGGANQGSRGRDGGRRCENQQPCTSTHLCVACDSVEANPPVVQEPWEVIAAGRVALAACRVVHLEGFGKRRLTLFPPSRYAENLSKLHVCVRHVAQRLHTRKSFPISAKKGGKREEGEGQEFGKEGQAEGAGEGDGREW